MIRQPSPHPGAVDGVSITQRASHHKISAAHPSRVPGLSAVDGNKAIKDALKEAIKLLERRHKELRAWDAATQKDFKGWFGTLDDSARKEIQERISLEIRKMRTLKVSNFVAETKPVKTPGMSAGDYDHAIEEYEHDFAYVDTDRRKGKYENTIHIGPQFASHDATTRAGTLIHELSHFWSVQRTEDVEDCKIYRKLSSDKPKTMEDCRVYGYAAARELAIREPKMALMNADNFEFFVERHDPTP